MATSASFLLRRVCAKRAFAVSSRHRANVGSQGICPGAGRMQPRHWSGRANHTLARPGTAGGSSNRSLFLCLGVPALGGLHFYSQHSHGGALANIAECSLFGGDEGEKRVPPSLKKADDMYDRGTNWQALYDFLKRIAEDSPDDPEVLWRLARATYELSEQPHLKKEEANALVFEAFEVAKHMLVVANDHFKSHSWYGILLNAVGEIQGSKKKISNLQTVKEHWIRATELNPKDASSFHLLGRWAKGIVEINWYMKQIAHAIYGRIPPSSYEEALEYFERAEQIDPGFWLQNQLCIAECYIALGKKDEGKRWLDRSLRIRVKTEEDKLARRQVEKILKKVYGVKA